MSVGMVPESMWKPPASAKGNHDNPVSGNHQAPSHWEKLRKATLNTYWYIPMGKGGWEWKGESADLLKGQRK